MEEEMDIVKKEEALDPIMMEEDHINQIMEIVGRTHSGVPYQYKINNKKRSIVAKEGLESDEQEVEDLRAVEKIEEILRATYERKTRGPGEETGGGTPIHISVSVEPINPCETNIPERAPPFRQLNFSGRNAAGSTCTLGETTGGASSGSSSQGYTLHEGSSSAFKMARHDPTIKLP
jgi:hypothetical protein